MGVFVDFADRHVEIPVGIVTDEGLSYFDIGVYVSLLASGGRDVGYRQLAKRLGAGEQAVRRALRRLGESGVYFVFEVEKYSRVTSLTVLTPTRMTVDGVVEELMARMGNGELEPMTIRRLVSHTRRHDDTARDDVMSGVVSSIPVSVQRGRVSHPGSGQRCHDGHMVVRAGRVAG